MTPISETEVPTAACILAEDLVVLGPVRGRAAVRVNVIGKHAWICWDGESAEVVRLLRPVRGVEFYHRHRGVWLRVGSRVPTITAPPEESGVALESLLFPASVTPLSPPRGEWRRLTVTLVPGGPPHPATALQCSLRDFAHWADTATTYQISRLKAAYRGERVLIRGESLPALSASRRYWGDTVLIPLGFRPEPDLAPSVLRTAARIEEDDLLIVETTGMELFSESAFTTPTRAGIRLAAVRT